MTCLGRPHRHPLWCCVLPSLLILQWSNAAGRTISTVPGPYTHSARINNAYSKLLRKRAPSSVVGATDDINRIREGIECRLQFPHCTQQHVSNRSDNDQLLCSLTNADFVHIVSDASSEQPSVFYSSEAILVHVPTVFNTNGNFTQWTLHPSYAKRRQTEVVSKNRDPSAVVRK